jgi:hypothetical protein
MSLLTLTAWNASGPTGYTIYLNTEAVIGFGPDPDNPGKAKIHVMHGPYWNLGNGGAFGVNQTPAQVAAMWPGVAAQSIPLSALITTGTPSATTFLRGDGAYITLNQP